MFRLLAVLAIPAVVLLAAPAAPVPKEKPKQRMPYYPTHLRDTWIEDDGTGNSGVPFAVTKIENKNGTKIVSVRLVPDRGVTFPWETVSVSEKGLFLLEKGQEKLTHPECLLKLPPRPGDRWTVQTASKGAPITMTRTIRGEEVVEVPAGKFKAIRIDLEWIEGGKPRRATSWYAPRVGRVKHKAGERTVVLKSFTPGKD